MSINFTDFSKAPILDSPLKNIMEDALKGYQIGRAPAVMAQAEKQKQMEGSLKQLELEHAPKKYEQTEEHMRLTNSLQSEALKHMPKKYSQEELLNEAKIKHYNQPEKLTSTLAQAFKVRDQFEKGSEDYNKANAFIDKLGTPAGKGIQVNSSPDGGFQVSIGGKGEEASVPGFPKLKIGEVAMYDQEGKPLAIGKPLDATEKKQAGGRLFFNTIQPWLTDAQAPYSGSGGTKQFADDVLAYSTDAASKSRIDNLLAADKSLFSATVNENATLGGANVKKSYEQLQKALQTSEIYPMLKEAAKYALPQGYAKASSDLFNQKLNEATEASQKVPAYKPFYLKPQKDQEKNSALSTALTAAKHRASANSATKAITYNNKTYNIPPDLVDRFLAEHAGAKLNG